MKREIHMGLVTVVLLLAIAAACGIIYLVQ